MQIFEFEKIKFRENDRIIAKYANEYYFVFEREELENIAPFEIHDSKIIFKTKKNIKMKFYNLLLEKMRREAINPYTNRKLSIVDHDFMYLLGNQYFGFIDRGTNIVEVRPLTGCINKCLFCSVSEGPGTSFWKRDFYVLPDYLIDYARKIEKIKGKDNLEWLVNPQGEIMLYPELPDLIQGLKKHGDRVGIITTLWPLKEKLILDAIDAGLDFISLSIHSLDPVKSKILLGNPDYDVKKVLEFVEQINEKVDVTFTPVIVKKYNLEDLERLVKFAKEKIKNRWRPVIAPQKYLVHKHGRKIRGERFGWKEFYEYLYKLERKYSVRLTFSNEDFKIEKKPEIKTPFRAGEIVKVEVVIDGRRKGEYMVNSRERTFSVYSDDENFDRVRITHAKHNIIIGEAI